MRENRSDTKSLKPCFICACVIRDMNENLCRACGEQIKASGFVGREVESNYYFGKEYSNREVKKCGA